jgi:hypothetical protein
MEVLPLGVLQLLTRSWSTKRLLLLLLLLVMVLVFEGGSS